MDKDDGTIRIDSDLSEKLEAVFLELLKAVFIKVEAEKAKLPASEDSYGVAPV